MHCLALPSVSITPERVVKILVSSFRNLFLAKLIFADFIVSTMQNCEPNVLNFADIYKKNDEGNKWNEEKL